MTIIIIVITALASIAAFNRSEILYKYIFSPYQIIHRKQWYRIFTGAFLHANWEHLIFNMISLYFFGPYVDSQLGTPIYLLIYVGAILISGISDIVKYKDDFNYSALGASGAVAAIIFSSILLNPTSKIMFIFLPIPIPAVIFGIIYLAYSAYMAKRNIDNVGHSTHFWGAIFGFVFPILLNPELLIDFFHRLIP